MKQHWEEMGRNSQAGNLAREQLRGREKEGTDKLSAGYLRQAEAVLTADADGVIRDELARFSEGILEAREGVELGEKVEQLMRAMKMRHIDAFDTVPEEEYEAFAIALSRAYKQMRQ